VSLRAQFLEMDDTLARHGVPPLTQWWRKGIGDWLDAYEQVHVLELWACVGRGSAKSTALYKLATFFALFGDFAVPPGERHSAIVLSRLKEEAAKGIAIISAWLTLLSVPHRLAGDVIELADLPRAIRVVAASVAASSGWRAFFVAKDERSKWPSGGVDELDAQEIDTSAAAMTATHPLAPVLSFGSAWGDFGEFYDAITGGSDAGRVVLGPAATWVAAPHIRKEDLQRKERDPKKFAREYECVFQSGDTSALDPDLVRACLRSFRRGYPLGAPCMGFDSSQGRRDATAWLIGQWMQPELDDLDFFEGEEVVENGVRMTVRTMAPDGTYKRKANAPEPPAPEFTVYGIGALEGGFAKRGVTSDQVVDHVADIALSHGVRNIFADEYQAFALTSAFARHRLAYIGQTWSVASKGDALMRLATWTRDGVLAIQPGRYGEALIKEMIGLRETIRPSGAVSLGARRGGFDDIACALLNLAMADGIGTLRGSPIQKRNGLIIDSPVTGRRYL
jgi:hypothetical protein